MLIHSSMLDAQEEIVYFYKHKYISNTKILYCYLKSQGEENAVKSKHSTMSDARKGAKLTGCTISHDDGEE